MLNYLSKKALNFKTKIGYIQNILYVYLSTIVRFTRARFFSPPKTKFHGNKILMLTISQIDVDPRIHKMAHGLAKAGFGVDVMCYSENMNTPGVIIEEVSVGFRLMRVPRKGLFTRSFNWIINLMIQPEFYEAGSKTKYDYVHVNDLTTLLTGWMLARIHSTPLIYDAHEMWSENVEWDGKAYVSMSERTRKVVYYLEKFLVAYVDIIISVSQSIVDEFERRYHLVKKPLLIANFPSLTLLDTMDAGASSIREICSLTDKHFITIYLGAVNELRNIENAIIAHRFLPEHCVFVIRGISVEYFQKKYETMAEEMGIGHRIFCVPQVEREKILSGMIGSDCGYLMSPNMCKNFYWSYPNKFFEYMLAGLPVLASNFPDVSAHIEKERCGMVCDPNSPEEIASAILWLYEHPDEARAMGERGRVGVLSKYNWEAAIVKLIEAYERL